MDMDIEAIRKQVEQQVMQYFHLEPTVTDAPYAGMVTGVDVISHLEHSLLNPDTTLETIERECAVARKYSVAAVCVAPYYVPAVPWNKPLKFMNRKEGKPWNKRCSMKL
jgi:deoxyribose-phosphate aldolase